MLFHSHNIYVNLELLSSFLDVETEAQCLVRDTLQVNDS